MFDYSAFRTLSPTTLADVLSGNQVTDIGIRALWAGMPRVAGPAYTVECVPGDNLVLHAAIYRAAPGSIIVVKAGDVEYAVSGGKEIETELNQPVRCGEVRVEPEDCVIGDEEGIVVVPVLKLAETLEKAQKGAAKEDLETLEEWETAHHARIEAILHSKGFRG